MYSIRWHVKEHLEGTEAPLKYSLIYYGRHKLKLTGVNDRIKKIITVLTMYANKHMFIYKSAAQ